MTTQTIDEQIKTLDADIAQQKSALVSSTIQPGRTWWTTQNAMTISSVVLVFALVVFSLATYLLRAGRDGEVILRVFGTIMIVFLAVFLVVAGYSDTQIAPVMGLLGTIAGYLLGKTAARHDATVEGHGDA